MKVRGPTFFPFPPPSLPGPHRRGQTSTKASSGWCGDERRVTSLDKVHRWRRRPSESLLVCDGRVVPPYHLLSVSYNLSLHRPRKGSELHDHLGTVFPKYPNFSCVETEVEPSK